MYVECSNHTHKSEGRMGTVFWGRTHTHVHASINLPYSCWCFFLFLVSLFLFLFFSSWNSLVFLFYFLFHRTLNIQCNLQLQKKKIPTNNNMVTGSTRQLHVRYNTHGCASEAPKGKPTSLLYNPFIHTEYAHVYYTKTQPTPKSVPHGQISIE